MRIAVSNRRSRTTIASALVVAGLVLAPPAGAATSFTLGPGDRPSIAMAATTAHIVWLSPLPTTGNHIRYCRLPAGATACDVTRDLPGGDWAPPLVFTGPGPRVVIVSSHCCSHAKAFISTDGGDTFPTEREIGDLPPAASFGAGAALGPGPEDVSLLGSSNEPPHGYVTVAYQRGNLLSQQAAEAPLQLDSGYQYSYALAMSGSIPVAAYSSPSNTLFSYYKGSGDIHSAANWAGPLTTPAPGGTAADLAGGPGGVYLMRSTRGGSAPRHLDVSRFTGSAFATPSIVPGSQDSNSTADLFQDATGRLHVIYNVVLDGTTALRYTTSGDGGARWSPVGEVIREPGVVPRFAVAAAGAGQGVAVWSSSGGTIKAAPLSPLIALAPGGATGPVGLPGPGAGGARELDDPSKKTSRTVGANTVLTLLAPRTCVPAGATFTVRVAAKLKTRLRRALRLRGRVTIRSVVFALDARKGVTDRKAPFSARLSATGLAAGSVHRVTARVSLRQKPPGKRARRFKATLTTTFRVC